jgi:hypothetical protein
MYVVCAPAGSNRDSGGSSRPLSLSLDIYVYIIIHVYTYALSLDIHVYAIIHIYTYARTQEAEATAEAAADPPLSLIYMYM